MYLVVLGTIHYFYYLCTFEPDKYEGNLCYQCFFLAYKGIFTVIFYKLILCKLHAYSTKNSILSLNQVYWQCTFFGYSHCVSINIYTSISCQYMYFIALNLKALCSNYYFFCNISIVFFVLEGNFVFLNCEDVRIGTTLAYIPQLKKVILCFK